VPPAVVADGGGDVGGDGGGADRPVEVHDAQVLELRELVQGGVDIVDVGLFQNFGVCMGGEGGGGGGRERSGCSGGEVGDPGTEAGRRAALLLQGLRRAYLVVLCVVDVHGGGIHMGLWWWWWAREGMGGVCVRIGSSAASVLLASRAQSAGPPQPRWIAREYGVSYS